MRNTLGFFCLNDGLKDYDLTVAKAQQDPQLPWMEEKKAYDEKKNRIRASKKSVAFVKFDNNCCNGKYLKCYPIWQ